jgi:hypothetical protein
MNKIQIDKATLISKFSAQIPGKTSEFILVAQYGTHDQPVISEPNIREIKGKIPLDVLMDNDLIIYEPKLSFEHVNVADFCQLRRRWNLDVIIVS